MVKRLSAQKSRSSFAELISLHNQTVEQAPESVAAIAGKQRGKSASPDYIKLTSYIRRETHLAVKKRLLDEGREISELVEELMTNWLASTGKEKL